MNSIFSVMGQIITSNDTKAAISALTVLGAWVGGLGVIFAVLSFSFGMINPRLMRIGLIWLVLADIGIFGMLVTLLFLIDSTVLWVFTIVGIVILVAITVFVALVLRLYFNKDQAAASMIDDTRRRIEF